MAIIDINYKTLLEKILQEGYWYDDPNRKDVKRLEIPSYTFRHEFKDGFPAITTKKLNYKNVITELIWFLNGDTNIKYLINNQCNIWNKDSYNYYKNKFLEKYPKYSQNLFSFDEFIERTKQDENTKNFQNIDNYQLGELGLVYGHQWRNWDFKEILYENGSGELERIDQISNLINNLKNKPLGTEHIINSWNVGYLKDMALPPCHYGFQIVVRPLNISERVNLGNFRFGSTVNEYMCDEQNIPKYGFELHWQQRSVDTFLGLPYNIASYATLALILEKLTGYKALGIQGDLKKVHLYNNSIDAINEQLSRDTDKYDKCELDILNRPEYYRIKTFGLETCSFDNLLSNIEIKDFNLENYQSYPHIKVEMLERDK